MLILMYSIVQKKVCAYIIEHTNSYEQLYSYMYTQIHTHLYAYIIYIYIPIYSHSFIEKGKRGKIYIREILLRMILGVKAVEIIGTPPQTEFWVPCQHAKRKANQSQHKHFSKHVLGS